MAYWKAIAAIIKKDLLLEVRSKEVVLSVSFFVLLMVFTFNFAFKPGSISNEIMTPGVLWFTFLFAGMLSFQRIVNSEQENGCLEALMLCPFGRDVIFLGKTLSSFLFIIIVEAIAIPIFTIVFNLTEVPLQLILIIPIATFGISTVGTFISVVSMNTRLKEVMLPILMIPMVVPAVIGAVESTGEVFGGGGWGDIQKWIWILIIFDITFLIVCLLTFEHVIEE